MKKTIERLELTNYKLYVLISILLGVVVFILTFFLTSRISSELPTIQKNKADEIVSIKGISDIGFDVEINSQEEVKVKYYFGKTSETLILFFESKDFVTQETQQFRSIVPDSNRLVQVEIETKSGEKIKSQIINVNDMLK